jgi:hypothetical protein
MEPSADVKLKAASDGSYGACQKPASVRIARSGELPHDGALSRDGSVHVTDEARDGAAPERSARGHLTRVGCRCSTPPAT